MSIAEDNARHALLERLYQLSGRTNGLLTGLYKEWSEAALKEQRDLLLAQPVKPPAP